MNLNNSRYSRHLQFLHILHIHVLMTRLIHVGERGPRYQVNIIQESNDVQKTASKLLSWMLKGPMYITDLYSKKVGMIYYVTFSHTHQTGWIPLHNMISFTYRYFVLSRVGRLQNVRWIIRHSWYPYVIKYTLMFSHAFAIGISYDASIISCVWFAAW